MRHYLHKGILLFIAFFLIISVCPIPHIINQVEGKTFSFSNPDQTYSNIQLDIADTNSPECRRIIHSLDSFYEIAVKRGFNGSVLIGYKGKILYERYFGYANLKNGIKLSPNTPSQLASTSKNFLATAILWLYQNNYLDINKPVNTYLKDFPYPDITVKMLMNHRSGLPKYLHFASRYWHSTPLKSNEDLLQLFDKQKPRLDFKPGTRFQYCNSNYAILARVLEEVTGLPYPLFMKQFIFKPLGMDYTYIYDPIRDAAQNSNAAISYQHNWLPWALNYSDGIYGDKNIYSTPRDLYRWDQSFYHHTLLNPKILKLAYTGCSDNMPGVRNYGLGWRMLEYPDDYKVIYHNGWWHGNNTVFYRFIKNNFTIIVLGNRLDKDIYNQSKIIYNIVQRDSKDHPQIDFDAD